MKEQYHIADIFYSLQSEGYFSGQAAVFVCFAHQDERAGMSMTAADIVETVMQYSSRHVVLTGVWDDLSDCDALISAFHDEGCYVQVETTAEAGVASEADWTTLIVGGTHTAASACDELLVVYEGQPVGRFLTVRAAHYYLLPDIDGENSNEKELIAKAIDTIMHDPRWSLTLPLHHYIDIK